LIIDLFNHFATANK